MCKKSVKGEEHPAKADEYVTLALQTLELDTWF